MASADSPGTPPAPVVGAPGGRSASASWRTLLWIAARYLLVRRHGYASLVNWVSFVGLALGVMILTVVVSVMNGFDREISSRLLSVAPHAVVTPATAEAAALADIDGVEHVGRYYQGEAMVTRAGATNFVAVSGYDDDGLRRVPHLVGDDALGRMLAGGGIVLGAPLARAMDLVPGDGVVLVASTPAAGGVRPRLLRFELAGTFAIGAEPDATLAVVHRDDLVGRGLADAGVDGWRLQLADPLAATRLAPRIRAALPEGAEARFWMEDYGDLFRAVRIEKAIMFALLSLIVAIAAFNIVSGQAMLVNDKRGDVAMLTTLGASRRLLVGVFFLQGSAVALVGVAVGLGAGVLIALNAGAVIAAFEGVVGASIIDGTWFSEVPSEVLGADLAIIAGLSMSLSLLGVLAPAWRATSENPAAALHSA